MFVWKKSTSFVQLSARARLDSSGYFASIVIIFASRRCVASGDFSIRAQQCTRRAEGQPAHADFSRVRLQNLDGAPLAASSHEDDGLLRRRFALVECPRKTLFFQGAVLHGEIPCLRERQAMSGRQAIRSRPSGATQHRCWKEQLGGRSCGSAKLLSGTLRCLRLCGLFSLNWSPVEQLGRCPKPHKGAPPLDPARGIPP